ncbi:MAG: hypothetical protein H6625_00535 [Bdellovibrionaceae bacterium]|nr:hypothetical protein [Pseudobdellovibrionaceae bacterium]
MSKISKISFLFVLFLVLSVQALGEVYFRKVQAGDRVEGSVRYGGLQPDYLIDSENSIFYELWNFADQIRHNDSLSIPHKVNLIIQQVRQVFSKHHEFNDETYLSLLKEYREKNTEIPLSKYIACGAGVCRENALLLHLTLERAGIPNLHVYAQVVVLYADTIPLPEDHGFVVFDFQNEKWIADSYYKQFNGYSFDEFLNNITTPIVPQKRLFFAEERNELRSIFKLNSYPQIISSLSPCNTKLQ